MSIGRINQKKKRMEEEEDEEAAKEDVSILVIDGQKSIIQKRA